MGCEVQIHEKTDTRGTWSYHSVDGWYLFTSPDHYRVHNCHTKSTKSERLSDTEQFQHKSITNPSLTPADKLMNVLAIFKVMLKSQGNDNSNQQLQEIQTLANQLEAHQTPTSAAPNTPTVPQVPQEPPIPIPATLPRVQTRSMTQADALSPPA